MNNTVFALTVFDDGTGAALYAGGIFTTADGMPANRVAKWDGSQWTALGAGVSGGLFTVVWALQVFDDGTGPALYAGGEFTDAGDVAANHIAKWDGTQWSPLGNGVGGVSQPDIYALTMFNDGTGPALYVGGRFTTAGDVTANRMAKWDGVQWLPLASGMNAGVSALTRFEDGTGSALYAGGTFTIAGDVTAEGVAKWDGTQWSPLNGLALFDIRALKSFDDGTGRALYEGSSLYMYMVAKWSCPVGMLEE